MNYLPNEIEQYAANLTYQSTAYALGALYKLIIQVAPWRIVSHPYMPNILKPNLTDVYLRLNDQYFININSGLYYEIQVVKLVSEYAGYPRALNVTTCYSISSIVDYFNSYVDWFQ